MEVPPRVEEGQNRMQQSTEQNNSAGNGLGPEGGVPQRVGERQHDGAVRANGRACRPQERQREAGSGVLAERHSPAQCATSMCGSEDEGWKISSGAAYEAGAARQARFAVHGAAHEAYQVERLSRVSGSRVSSLVNEG